MNLAILTKQFNGLKVDTEYTYTHDRFPNGKEIVDVYEKHQRLATCTPETFEQCFMKVRLVES